MSRTESSPLRASRIRSILKGPLSPSRAAMSRPAAATAASVVSSMNELSPAKRGQALHLVDVRGDLHAASAALAHNAGSIAITILPK